MSANEKVFFDSNILVYFADNTDERKQKIADKLIKAAAAAGNGIVSTQSLQEFFNVSTKKLKCSKEKAKEYVETFSSSFDVTQISVSLILAAIDVSIKHKLSFWDSLIVAAARESASVVLYSEDLNDGEIIDGIKVCNPFSHAA